MIYAAASRALCALEILANADELAGDYEVTPIEVPDDLPTTTLPIEALPPNWDASLSVRETADIGTNWAADRSTAILAVPSAVIPRELNYILTTG